MALICTLRRFVPWDVLSLGSVVPWDVLSLEALCPLRRFVRGTFFLGKFCLRTCCLGTFCVCIAQSSTNVVDPDLYSIRIRCYFEYRYLRIRIQVNLKTVGTKC